MVHRKSSSKKRVVRQRRRKSSAKKRSGVGKSRKQFAVAMRKITKMSPSQRVQALRLANDKFIRQLSQTVKLLKHRRVSSRLRKHMRRHSKKLRKFSSPSTSIQVKRKMLSQRGGFLPFLIPLAGTIISSAIGALRK